MADFVANLWDSVFTPGTTPTLLLATNATFACLQLTLAALLAATYSIHFVILSVLCGCLWWSINWFADEVRQAQEKEEESNRINPNPSNTRGGENNGEIADDEGGDTETEDSNTRQAEITLPKPETVFEQPIVKDSLDRSHITPAAQTTGLQLPTETTHRKPSSDISNDASTDSEWEKVER